MKGLVYFIYMNKDNNLNIGEDYESIKINYSNEIGVDDLIYELDKSSNFFVYELIDDGSEIYNEKNFLIRIKKNRGK